jgi:uncharacterized membrane protein SirB2
MSSELIPTPEEEVARMVVQKSDAMIQHEKWIAEVVAHKHKRGKQVKMLPEAPDLIMVVAGILIIVVAALSIIYR